MPSHAQRHSKPKNTERTNNIQASLAPDVTQLLGDLAAHVQSNYFDSDAYSRLEVLAAGKPQPVEQFLVDMLLVQQEVGSYIKKTGSSYPEILMDRILDSLIEGGNLNVTSTPSRRR